MLPPNPIIGGHVYNWYECKFSFDTIVVEGVLEVTGTKEKIEQSPQYGTGREPIDLATGHVEYDPITVTMYAYEWQRVKAYLTAKSLGRGYGHAKFMFTVMATGNPITGAPPVGDVWECKVSEVGKEFSQGPDGNRVEVTLQPMRHRDLDGMSIHNF
jgi:hypothetical protein